LLLGFDRFSGIRLKSLGFSRVLRLHSERTRKGGCKLMMNIQKSRFNILSLIGAALLFTGSAHAAPEKVLNFSMAGEPPTLNQAKATDAESFFILGHLMEGLMRYGKDGKIVPGVAESHTLNDQEAVFKLRKNAKWSDGKPVTAKDFVFAWRTVVDPKTASEYAFIMYPVKNAEAIAGGKKPVTELGVQAVDDHTLKVTFERPCGYFLGLTAFVTYAPIREDVYTAKKDKFNAEATDIVSNGAFKMTKWVHGASLEMVKNENYWNAKEIKLDKISVPYMTPDNTARFNFFKDKKIDVVGLTKDDLPKAQAEKYSIKSHADGTLFFMEFNFREGRPTRNLNLRKAIAAGYNSQEHVSKVIGIPGTRPGLGLIPNWMRGKSDVFRKEYPLQARRPNMAEAKKFLELAKKELGGKIPPLVWLTGDTPLSSKEAEYMQQYFKQLGLELRIDKQIFKQRLAKMSAGDFDIVAAGWGPDYADPMTFADLWTSWNENNRGKYSSPELDKAIREAMATSDAKKRMDAMARAEKIALDDLAALPTYERTILYVQNPRLQGVARHQVGPDPDFTYASIKD
jgi:oligopeptide transport system substrate-binding protein